MLLFTRGFTPIPPSGALIVVGIFTGELPMGKLSSIA